jgi:hypothetical protein
MIFPTKFDQNIIGKPKVQTIKLCEVYSRGKEKILFNTYLYVHKLLQLIGNKLIKKNIYRI